MVVVVYLSRFLWIHFSTCMLRMYIWSLVKLHDYFCFFTPKNMHRLQYVTLLKPSSDLILCNTTLKRYFFLYNFSSHTCLLKKFSKGPWESWQVGDLFWCLNSYLFSISCDPNVSVSILADKILNKIGEGC